MLVKGAPGASSYVSFLVWQWHITLTDTQNNCRYPQLPALKQLQQSTKAIWLPVIVHASRQLWHHSAGVNDSHAFLERYMIYIYTIRLITMQEYSNKVTMIRSSKWLSPEFELIEAWLKTNTTVNWVIIGWHNNLADTWYQAITCHLDHQGSFCVCTKGNFCPAHTILLHIGIHRGVWW